MSPVFSPNPSFPRKRESMVEENMDSRFRGNDGQLTLYQYWLAVLVLAVALSAASAHAQLSSNAEPGVSNHVLASRAPVTTLGTALLKPPPSQSAAQQRDLFPLWMSPLFSAVVPGAGQLRMGESRFAAYMAVEAYGWINYARHRADARRDRDGYRALAADVARALFTTNPLLGDFDYYESMEKFVDSGVFDASEDPGLQPEPNDTTFNGSLWRRARETFWDDPNVVPAPSSPQYERSITYYQERAVTSEFRWSWRNARLIHDQYKRTIAGSNDGFRRSVQDLGVIIGNHVLSMVDAFAAVRLRASGSGTTRSYSVMATIPARVPQP